MDIELFIMEAEEKMQAAVNSYESNISKISTGRANPNILQSVRVNYYETPTPLNELANVSVPEPRQLLITPFDPSVNSEIAGAINSAQLGVNGVDEGDKVRITFPELTTERRRELVKSLAQYTEQGKIQIRGARQDVNKHIKSSDDLSEDQERAYLENTQKLTDNYIAKIDTLTKEKEKDLMTI